MRVYPNLGGKPNSTVLTWKFPSGNVVKFAPAIFVGRAKMAGFSIDVGFDQVEVFEADQF